MKFTILDGNSCHSKAGKRRSHIRNNGKRLKRESMSMRISPGFSIVTLKKTLEISEDKQGELNIQKPRYCLVPKFLTK